MESKSFFGKDYVQVLLTLALVGVIVALASYAYLTIKQSEGVQTNNAIITVSGKGEVFAKPDIGTFSFSVHAEGKDASEAQSKSAQGNNAVVAYLKSAGVDEKDIKTTDYNLSPKYKYEQQPCPVSSSFVIQSCPPANPVIDGYQVDQTVTVKVRDLSKAGDLISGVGNNGATNISSLQFTIDDESAITMQARQKAIDDARKNADALAKDLGVHIVRMTGYSEDQGVRYMNYAAAPAMEAKDSAAGTAPSVPTGENTITSNVNVSYEVK